ncbi:MAG: HAD family hydrolase [Acidimicrobiia bacterium]|nr:HAD family hydrolase [Acidimicrobiia bacterium]
MTSAGDVEEAKPAPEVFQVALARAGGPATRAVAVGDSTWDVVAARAGLGCVGLRSGGISTAELEEAGALAVYEGPADLRDHLAESPLGQVWVSAPDLDPRCTSAQVNELAQVEGSQCGRRTDELHQPDDR